MGVPSGYTSAQVVQAVPTGINSALVLIKTETIGTTVTSVTVSNAFSATYDNYLIRIDGGVASASCGLQLKLGSATANYRRSSIYMTYNSNTVSGDSSNSASFFDLVGYATTSNLNARIDVFSPFLSKTSQIHSQGVRAGESAGQNAVTQGTLNDTTSHTSFIIQTSAGETLTGGTIRVYGYTNS